MSDPARMTYGDVLVVLRPTRSRDPNEILSRTRRRLGALYGEVLPNSSAFARWDRSGTHVIAGVTRQPLLEPTGRTVWGTPVGAGGEATEAELAAVTANPLAARALIGPWVLLEETDDGPLLVSGSDLVHTLVRASGPDGVAYATRGLAALRVTGAPLRIALDRVPELIAFGYVMMDDELLDGTEVLPEAAVVRSDARGDRVSTYWSVEERFAPGPPTTASHLRDVVTADLVRLADVPGAHVALTSGRDSTLVVSCLRDAGIVLPALTMGYEGFPDVMGARAVAAAWGTDHRLLTPAASGSPDLARAVRSSAWTEGLEMGWNLVGGGMTWEGPDDVTWLGGNGGEIGRATYGKGRRHPAPDDELVLKTLILESTPPYWRRPRRVLEPRVRLALDSTKEAGRAGWDMLDVVYARGWMRKWLLRSLPRPEVRGMLTGYTSPAVVGALLNIPLADRVSKSVFDEAIALSDVNLHRIAQQAVPPRLPSGAARVSRLRRLTPSTVGPAVRRVRPSTAPGPLGETLAALPRDLVCHEAMGRSWWRETVHVARHSPRARNMLWHAVAVEALAMWLREADVS
ncbi:MAG: hypothetical protein M3P04_00040 [Actinomycetota bacterium]|nr:hypothetical protein [Actinomycetota bacterium]